MSFSAGRLSSKKAGDKKKTQRKERKDAKNPRPKKGIRR
jgi:hypothetical protein